ncbi:MAG: Rrf2 family transcriptional regulator [Gammaproteobacteria bacterium]|nr:Rrf2 family transcriptional regulator [Gammaproteobacteria bacterium]
MQLTRYTDYSLRVLIFLAIQPPERRSTINEIADRFEISRNHLVKIVHRLGQLGYVRTIRGKGGGLCIGAEPDEINLGAVVRDTEATLDVINCTDPYCPVAPACRLKGVLNEARDAFLAVLDRYTLADLIHNRAQLASLLRMETR